MVRDNKLDRPVRKPFPKLLTIFTLTNRRATLELRRAISDRLRREMKIMRTRLSTDLQTVRLCPTQQRHSIG